MYVCLYVCGRTPVAGRLASLRKDVKEIEQVDMEHLTPPMEMFDQISDVVGTFEREKNQLTSFQRVWKDVTTSLGPVLRETSDLYGAVRKVFDRIRKLAPIVDSMRALGDTRDIYSGAGVTEGVDVFGHNLILEPSWGKVCLCWKCSSQKLFAELEKHDVDLDLVRDTDTDTEAT